MNTLVIDDRFVINNPVGDLIGRGGMGNVYQGVDNQTGEIVAIKALKPELVAHSERIVDRFLREGEALIQLNHPNIVRMVGAAYHADQYFLVMEYVSGGSLRDLMLERGRLPLRRVLEIALELADALARAHHLGIVHRDIKPANVLIAEDGAPRLTDFGVAHVRGSARLTESGILMGTAAYLSPEACRDDPLDARTDIWAFGTMLYELLTGKLPFARKNTPATILAIVQEPVPPLTTYRPDLPPELVDLVHGMLQKERAQRIGSMRLVAARLEALLKEENLAAYEETQIQPADGIVFDTPVLEAEQDTTPSTGARRRRQLLLDKVENYWVKGVLEQAVVDQRLIELAQRRYDEAVERPWDDVFPPTLHPLAKPYSQRISQIFYQADRALLILGMPGAGKTITLIQLARDLIQTARQSPHRPLPVILNLSSWAAKREPISTWILQELTSKYQIPPKIGRPWLEEDRLLLLLDGLDEMPPRQQAECVHALNTFRQEHGLTGIVVCSRAKDYETLNVKLRMGGAIMLQPLTAGQIDTYLAQAGDQLKPLRQALAQDEALREIAKSPIMLSLMTIAYSGRDPILPDALESRRVEDILERRRRALLEKYVDRMFERRGALAAYAPAQTKTWLSWLAGKITDHNQTVFLIEEIQPSWLPSAAWRWAYALASRLIGGLIIGFVLWIFIQLGKQNIPDFEIGFLAALAAQFNLPPALAEIVPLTVSMLFLGFIVGVTDGIFFERRRRYQNEAKLRTPAGWRQLVTTGVSTASLSALLGNLFDTQLFAAVIGLVVGVSFLLGFNYLESGQSLRTEIRPVEALSWSWGTALKGALVGLLLGIATGILMGELYGLKNGLAFGLGFIVAFALLGGLRRRQIEIKQSPNQGMWLSAQNGVIAAALFGGVMGLFLGVYYNLASGLIGLAMFSLTAGLLYGWIDVIKHVEVRGLLWLIGRTPLNYVHFLNHAADCALVHKVGGGYIFIHRLLQEYFADLDWPEAEA